MGCDRTRSPKASQEISQFIPCATFPVDGPQDLTTRSDIDMKSANSDGRLVHKDGTPSAEDPEALKGTESVKSARFSWP